MSKINISYRGPVVWNMIVFVLFSVLFLFLQSVYLESTSVLNRDVLDSFIQNKRYIFVFYILTLVLAFKLHKMAGLLFWISVGLTSFETVGVLVGEFSKFIVILLFFYLLCSYYLYQFFTQEQSESYYTPLFEQQDLFQPMCKKIKVSLRQKDNIIAKGHLTNWSETGFFIYLPVPLIIKGRVQVEIHFEGQSFYSEARIVSRLKNASGMGFKTNPSQAGNDFNWKEFISIIKDMGYEPRLLR